MILWINIFMAESNYFIMMCIKFMDKTTPWNPHPIELATHIVHEWNLAEEGGYANMKPHLQNSAAMYMY